MKFAFRFSLMALLTLCLSASMVSVGPPAMAAQAEMWSAPVRGSWVRPGTPQAGDVRLASGGKGCVLVVASTEQPAVQQAARFLAGDIQKISGYRPPIMTRAAAGRAAIYLATLGVTPVPGSLGAARMKGLWEAHQVTTRGGDVWLVGANFRGTAFAAYTLSERLGIDPLYLWTGYTPEKHAALVLKATRYYAAPPTFRFRGMFHDDEDVLPRPFVSGIPDQNGTVPTAWYARFFETALRLRMNMVAPFVRVQRPYAVRKMASDWGLYYTSHHYDSLLSNPYGYDRFGLAKARGVTGPYDWITNKGGVLKFWQGGLDENRDLHCIWPVGLRGTEDYGMSFPAGTTTAQKADVFSTVIADQVRMTKAALPPGEPALFHFTMYAEMLDIYRQGQMQVPPDVTLVWPDNNDGVMLALPPTVGQWKHGVYYHLAYLGPQFTKQTFHTVQPSRVASEFQKINAAHATDYMLVNVSELRTYVMETRMLADICWESQATLTGTDPATRYVQWWSREYFGPAAAPLAAKAYADYYRMIPKDDALYIGTGKVMGALGSLKRKLAGQLFTQANPATLPMLQQRAKDYAGVMQDITAASAKMTPPEQRFFFEHVTLGLLSDYRTTQSAILLVQAMFEPSLPRSLGICRDAQAPLDQLETEIQRGERAPFAGWYGPTWILRPESALNPHSSYLALTAFLAGR